MVYEEFQLLATEVQTVKEGGEKRIVFRIRVPQSPSGEKIKAVPSAYDARQMKEQLKTLERGEVDWSDVIQMGHWLGSVLFPQGVRELLVRSLDRVEAQGKGLRIRLMLEGTLYNIPWEYALVNRAGGEATVTDFVALMPNVSVVRHQAAEMPAWDVEAALPARMVVASASPGRYPPLDVDEEQRVIAQALKATPHVEATFVPNATPKTVLPGGARVHLFHFAGHGDVERLMGAVPGTAEGKGFLILDDGYGDPEVVNAGELALKLRRAGVRAAVLGACNSGRRDDVNVWSSVAAALLKVKLGAVVGMQYTIRDDSAIAFASAFYPALVAGLPIDEAVTNGRLAISEVDARGWGVPVLYLRAPDGVIFPEHADDLSLEKVRGQLRVTAQQQIGVLRGKAVTVDIGEMGAGVVEAKQDITEVAEGGEAITVKIDKLGGGTVDAQQKIEEVGEGGSATGVKIDKLG